jgi:hypothetical protein
MVFVVLLKIPCSPGDRPGLILGVSDKKTLTEMVSVSPYSHFHADYHGNISAQHPALRLWFAAIPARLPPKWSSPSQPTDARR